MRQLLFLTCAALTLGAPALAQGPEAVERAVERMRQMIVAGGGSATIGGSAREDGALVLRDLRVVGPDGESAIETDRVRLDPAGDGSGNVTVTLAPLVTVTIDAPGDMPPATVEIRSEGFSLTSNALLGQVEVPEFDLSADSLQATGGNQEHPVLKALVFDPGTLSASGRFDTAARDLDGRLSMSQVDIAYTIADPASGRITSSETSTDGMEMTVTGTGLPEGEESLPGFLSGGSFDLSITGGSGTLAFSSEDPEFPFSVTAEGEANRARITVEDGSFRYLTEFGAGSYQITPDPSVMPMPPFDISMAGGIIEVAAPVAPSEEPQDVKLLLRLQELVLGETLWAMVDPEQLIPREPFELELDALARMQLARSIAAAPRITNPMQMGQVESVDLNTLHIAGGGADISASGAVTVDNSARFPMPEGSVDVRVEGVQALARKLVDLGLIQQAQMGMAMGMMMAFAQPAGEDVFTSTIEFRDGRILANGEPVR